MTLTELLFGFMRKITVNWVNTVFSITTVNGFPVHNIATYYFWSIPLCFYRSVIIDNFGVLKSAIRNVNNVGGWCLWSFHETGHAFMLEKKTNTKKNTFHTYEIFQSKDPLISIWFRRVRLYLSCWYAYPLWKLTNLMMY